MAIERAFEAGAPAGGADALDDAARMAQICRARYAPSPEPGGRRWRQPLAPLEDAMARLEVRAAQGRDPALKAAAGARRRLLPAIPSVPPRARAEATPEVRRRRRPSPPRRQAVLLVLRPGEGIGLTAGAGGVIDAIAPGGAADRSGCCAVGDCLLDVGGEAAAGVARTVRITIARGGGRRRSVRPEPRPASPSVAQIAKLTAFFGRDPTPVFAAMRREQQFSVRRGVRRRRPAASVRNEEKVANLVAAADTALTLAAHRRPAHPRAPAAYGHRFSKRVVLSDKRLLQSLVAAGTPC